MAWRLTGQLIETCSCNMLCPCWFTVQELMIMDQGWCASAIAFRTREGNSDGIALGGRTVVFAVDFPGPTMFDGNATARLYVDEEANADQRRELEAICSGQKGGPDGGHCPAIAKWLPARSAKIGVADEDDTITVRSAMPAGWSRGACETRGPGLHAAGRRVHQRPWNEGSRPGAEWQADGPIRTCVSSKRSPAPEANSPGVI